MEKTGNNFRQLDESLFSDGYNLCNMFLFKGFTQGNLFAAQKQLYKVIDEFNASFLKRAEVEVEPAECRMGCSYCCHQTVLATPAEFFYLAGFLRNKFREDVLQSIIEKAKAKMEKTGTLKIDKLLKYKAPCPLLHPTGGYCRAYQARPMACRIYFSKSIQSCRDDLNSPEDDTVFPDLFDLPLRVGRMLNEGFHARLRKEKESIQLFENTIEEGIFVALKDGIFEKWTKGENVFKMIKS
ncbi:MAG: YkgJ family cysteine cluster protein [Prolixibacteraceae bacterium]|nr:YkgJ family cysteine cluster protein [Prolixibacteraceae bacterium]